MRCYLVYTAISRKVVGKSARDNPERYCGRFWVYCSSKKFERMARSGEAIDVCLWVLKESNNRRLDSCIVRNSVLIIFHPSGIVACTFFPTTFLERAVYIAYCGWYKESGVSQSWLAKPTLCKDDSTINQNCKIRIFLHSLSVFLFSQWSGWLASSFSW